MKLAAQPGIVARWLLHPVYRTRRFVNADQRFHPFLRHLIPRLVIFGILLILLTQTTRELPIHPLANQQGHAFHPLKLFLGKHTTLNSLSLAPI